MSKVPAQTRSPAAPLLGEVRLEVCTELSQVSSEQWNRLLSSDDAPLLSWEYLQALEESGCGGEATGWHGGVPGRETRTKRLRTATFCPVSDDLTGGRFVRTVPLPLRRPPYDQRIDDHAQGHDPRRHAV